MRKLDIENFKTDLVELCRKYKVELESDEYDTHVNVWDIPREVDLDANDKPREYPAFKFTHVMSHGID